MPKDVDEAMCTGECVTCAYIRVLIPLPFDTRPKAGVFGPVFPKNTEGTHKMQFMFDPHD